MAQCKCFRMIGFNKIQAILYCKEKFGLDELGGLKAVKLMVESVPSDVAGGLYGPLSHYRRLTKLLL